METKMKKIVIVLLFGLTMAMPVSAQYHRNPATGHVVSTGGYRGYNNGRENYRRSDNEVYYGLRLGVVSSTVNSDDQYLDGSDSKAGLNIGAVLGYQLNPSVPLYLETGLYYTEKGGKGHVSGAKFTYNLDYLEVPIVVKYKLAIETTLIVVAVVVSLSLTSLVAAGVGRLSALHMVIRSLTVGLGTMGASYLAGMFFF
jgi:hypothetical protein